MFTLKKPRRRVKRRIPQLWREHYRRTETDRVVRKMYYFKEILRKFPKTAKKREKFPRKIL